MQEISLLRAGVSLALAVHLGASALRWLEIVEGESEYRYSKIRLSL